MTTDVQGVRDLVVKGFGLYCLGTLINWVPLQVVVFLQAGSEVPLVARVSGLVMILGYAALGFFCVFQTRVLMRLCWRGDEPMATRPPLSNLTALVSLFGLCYAIRAAGLVAQYAWDTRHPHAYSIASLIGAAATLAFALWLVRKPKSIAEYILKSS